MDNEDKLLQDKMPSPSISAGTTTRLVRTPSPSAATSPHTPPLQPLVQTFTAPLHRKKGRLQRSERLQTIDNSSNSSSGNNSTSTPTSFSAWESLVKESFGQIAWPIKITSWELVDDRVKIVPNSAIAQYQTGQSGYYPTQTGQYSGQTTYNPYQAISQYPSQSTGGGYVSSQTSYQQPSSYTSTSEESGSSNNPNNRIFGLLGGNRGGLLGSLLGGAGGGGGGGGGLLGNLFGLGGNRNPVASAYPVPVPAPGYGSYPGSFGGYPGGLGGYPAYGGFNGYYG